MGFFSYLVGAARTNDKERYSAPVFLGDRIKIEAVSIGEKTVTVSYLTHPANVPLATLPTKSVTVIYTFQDDGNLQASLRNTLNNKHGIAQGSDDQAN